HARGLGRVELLSDLSDLPCLEAHTHDGLHLAVGIDQGAAGDEEIERLLSLPGNESAGSRSHGQERGRRRLQEGSSRDWPLGCRGIHGWFPDSHQGRSLRSKSKVLSPGCTSTKRVVLELYTAGITWIK